MNKKLQCKYYTKKKRKKEVIDTLLFHYASRINLSDKDPINVEPGNPYNAESIVNIFNKYKVSRHILIGRQGQIYILVPYLYMAWHAGKSKMPKIDPKQRSNVNRFSLGIQLIRTAKSGFTDAQYAALGEVIWQLINKNKFPLKYITGHDKVSPGRKIDPGNKFDWKKVNRMFKMAQKKIKPMSIQKIQVLNSGHNVYVSKFKIGMSSQTGVQLKGQDTILSVQQVKLEDQGKTIKVITQARVTKDISNHDIQSKISIPVKLQKQTNKKQIKQQSQSFLEKVINFFKNLFFNN